MRPHRTSYLGSALLATLWLSLPATAAATEWRAGVGGLLITTEHGDGRFGDLYLTPEVYGRTALGPVLIDGHVLASLPTAEDAFLSTYAAARVGYQGGSWSLAIGPQVQWSPDSRVPLQLLPSLRTEARFGRWGFAVGVFDQGFAPVHVALLFDQHELGFVPLGVMGRTSVQVGDFARVHLQVLAFQLFNASRYQATLSGEFGSRGGAR